MSSIRLYLKKTGWEVVLDTLLASKSEMLGRDLSCIASDLQDVVVHVASIYDIAITRDDVAVEADCTAAYWDAPELSEEVFDEITMAVDAADVACPEQVADVCRATAREGRDWRRILEAAVEFDRNGGNTHISG